MNVPIRADLMRWVEQEVEKGRYPSEEAAVNTAIEKLRGQPKRTIEDLIDQDALARADRAGDESISFEEIRAITSKDSSSWSDSIIHEVRENRCE
jgi:Arc/MetJ-type ribon-helix-helix transcriptional regulator